MDDIGDVCRIMVLLLLSDDMLAGTTIGWMKSGKFVWFG
jgi:hypothetical protein